MSLIKYIENKPKTNIHINMDEYKEKLNADISSLLLKPDERISEVKKYVFDVQKASSILSEINYPLRNEFFMAIRSGCPLQVQKAYKLFKKYTENANLDYFKNQIETALLDYQTKLYLNQFKLEDANDAIKSFIFESQLFLDHVSHQIKLVVSKINDWNGHNIVIEALYPKSGWVVSEAKITVGDRFPAIFTYEKTSIGFKIQNLIENKLPEILKNNVENLISKLKNNDKYESILTLYAATPFSERKYLESIKRDLSLGIKTVLSNRIELFESPFFEQLDVWKIRVDEMHVKEYIDKTNVKKYRSVEEEYPVYWIERIEN